MSLESHSLRPNRTRPPEFEERVPLQIPRPLGRLDSAAKSKFDDLMARVIPWRGVGYTYGLNALFSAVPDELIEDITQYVEGTSDKSPEAFRENLLERLRAIYDQKKLSEMSDEKLRSFTLQ